MNLKKLLDEDELILADDSKHIKVYAGWKNTNLVKKGERITVRRKLDPDLIKEFNATEIIRENDQLIKLNTSG